MIQFTVFGFAGYEKNIQSIGLDYIYIIDISGFMVSVSDRPTPRKIRCFWEKTGVDSVDSVDTPFFPIFRPFYYVLAIFIYLFFC